VTATTLTSPTIVTDVQITAVTMCVYVCVCVCVVCVCVSTMTVSISKLCIFHTQCSDPHDEQGLFP